MVSNLFDILEPHAKLDELLLRGDPRIFLSDWNGEHPFAREYLGDLAYRPYAEWGSLTQYSEMQYDEELKEKIAQFHSKRDGVEYDAESVYPAAGAAGFLTTVAFWLQENHFGEVHYLPPLYYNLAWWLRRLNCQPKPAASGHVIESDFTLTLPNRRSVLLLTDPLWYAGQRVPADVLQLIREWQERTGSLVFVDGTFQYLGWDEQPGELSASLVPELTLRLVCPTKALGMHGCRFAYLLVPLGVVDQIGELHGNLHGPASLSDRVFAHRAMDVLGSPTSNRRFVQFARSNYRRLIESGAFSAHLAPQTGYFVFGRPTTPRENFLAMDETFYELADHPGYVRVNLAKPTALDFLVAAADAGNRANPVAPA